MADLTRDDILKLAYLARIELTDSEVTEFAKEFSEILHYVEQLKSVDTSGLEPTSQVTGLTNVMRPDEISSFAYRQADLMKNVPAKEGEQIKVKRMIG